MYSKSFDEKITTGRRNEDYELCNVETDQKFIIHWTPQNRGRFLSKNRYGSSRSLSKSLPGKNRGIVRYNINRSLNFDTGVRNKSDNFGSPNFSSDSNASTDNEQYLSRSAKILRALNIDCSPLKIAGLGIRKINKSLNFDFSPNSKGLVKFNESPRNTSIRNSVSPLTKINKTLNFETSSGESSVKSRLDSSVESIDENQNQTPSQRNRKAKKSLNYSSRNLQSNNFAAFDVNVNSPMLRTKLKKKIDIIVQSKMTPHLPSPRRQKFDDISTSTPRNLFNDFDDGDDEETQEVDGRPQTPVNVIQIVPESMRAIKKSHKKERVLGRLGKAVAYHAESCSDDESLTVHSEQKGNTLMTPLAANRHHSSPQYSCQRKKKSAKKNERKRKISTFNTEDDMSETGSIFDYTDEANALSDDEDPQGNDEHPEFTKLREKRNSQPSDDDKKNENNSDHDREVSSNTEVPSSIIHQNTPVKQPPGTPSSDSESTRNEMAPGVSDTSIAHTNRTVRIVTTPDNSTRNSPQPVTPENNRRILPSVMTDSIKKSHKKIKDANKKLLFKPRMNQVEADEEANVAEVLEEDTGSFGEGDRASTPENTNSSRLLLSQFSSVKKSHRKNKHKRMLSGSLQRKKFFGRNNEAGSALDQDANNCSGCSSVSDLPSLSPTESFTESVARRKSNSHETSVVGDSSGDQYEFLGRLKLDDNACEIGVDALPSSRFPKPSPMKRKNVSDDLSLRGNPETPKNQGSVSMPCESPEEEFKIFTPIKKRRSLNLVAPIARRIRDENVLPLESDRSSKIPTIENATTRCCTPISTYERCTETMDDSFKTPDRNPSNIPINDRSTPVLCEIANVDDDNSNNGRLTPQNQPTSLLMVDIDSIKKSHKKDKRGSVKRRSMIGGPEAYKTKLASNVEDNSSKSQIRESPSSSNDKNHRVIDQTDNLPDEEKKTPPNCLKAKSYLKLLQSESIKKSHKKDRERKKYRPIVMDAELSDDSLIFDESARGIDVEDEGASKNEAIENNIRVCDSLSSGSKKNPVRTSFSDKVNGISYVRSNPIRNCCIHKRTSKK